MNETFPGMLFWGNKTAVRFNSELDEPITKELALEILAEEERKPLMFNDQTCRHWTFAEKGGRTGLWHEIDGWEDAELLTISVWR